MSLISAYIRFCIYTTPHNPAITSLSSLRLNLAEIYSPPQSIYFLSHPYSFPYPTLECTLSFSFVLFLFFSLAFSFSFTLSLFLAVYLASPSVSLHLSFYHFFALPRPYSLSLLKFKSSLLYLYRWIFHPLNVYIISLPYFLYPNSLSFSLSHTHSLSFPLLPRSTFSLFALPSSLFCTLALPDIVFNFLIKNHFYAEGQFCAPPIHPPRRTSRFL